MSATYELFTRWKAAKGYGSDAAAMRALSLHPTALTPWKQGRNGSPAVIERMAKDLGEDPVGVVLQAFAESARDAEDKRALGRLARRFGAACLALLALFPLMLPSNAQAIQVGHSESPGIYIMRNGLIHSINRALQYLRDFLMESFKCSLIASSQASR